MLNVEWGGQSVRRGFNIAISSILVLHLARQFCTLLLLFQNKFSRETFLIKMT